MTEDEVIEKIVQAQYDLEFGHGAFAAEKATRIEMGMKWPTASFSMLFVKARAILSLLPSLGLVMVPVEATEEMCAQGELMLAEADIWTAMLRASPFYKGERG